MLVLITGASSGLGEALCFEFAKKNVDLLITARNSAKLEKISQTLKPLIQVKSLTANLSDPASRKQVVSLIRENAPDLIINNAGLGLYGPALEHEVEEELNIIEVNIKAVVELTIEAARVMIERGKKGTILNISSAASFFSAPYFCTYAASKAFINQFSEGFATEVAAYGISILYACPGQIDTDFRRHASKGYSQQKDWRTMSAQRAALLIIKQIEQKRSCYIFDWRYLLGVYLGKCLPKTILHRLFQKTL
ncbi:MAG: SDR family NAD(P)-dependent oxidoreductase, partial [Anaerolineae bacterium]